MVVKRAPWLPAGMVVAAKAQQSPGDKVTFSVEIGVGNRNGGPLTPVTAVVNSSVVDSILPASLLKGLGVQPMERDTFVLPDGSLVEYEIGQARIALDGRERHCMVVFGPEDWYQLGSLALDVFHLMVEPAERKLVRRQMYARAI